MTTESLVQRSIDGDVEAFAELVKRYQGMAFAYALTMVRDYHLAEDATQQAMITAYRHLGSLRDRSRFGGWLRGIVRYESLRIVRDRTRHSVQSLDADDLALPDDRLIDPEREAEIASDVREILALMARLPERQRVVAQLYYLGDQSQAAVAEFLGLTVSAVNNRLREARGTLRREGAHLMSTSSIKTPEFAEAVGKVIRASDLTIDARIDPAARPALLTAVEVGDTERAVAAFVSQYLDDDTARLIVIESDATPSSVARGMPVRSKGTTTGFQASADAIGRIVETSRTSRQSAGVLTGIKVIDCFAPMVRGGVVAIVGAMNVGKLVLVEELVARLNQTNQSVTLLVFLKSPDELGVAHQLEYRRDGSVAVMLVPVADASPGALVSSLDRMDTVLVMSQELGQARMYPAIDPVASFAIAKQTSETADRAKEMLRSYPDGVRSGLLRAYFTQPFFVAEPYTGRPGVSVGLAEAEADIARLLGGDVSGLEADTLLMGGSLADIDERAQR